MRRATVKNDPFVSTMESYFLRNSGNSASLVREFYLTASCIATDTTVNANYIPKGLQPDLGWLVIDPYTSECEFRKVTNITGTTLTIAALDYGHALNDVVLWIDRPVLNPKWFGAVGDGSTDDSTAVDRCITQAFAVAGTVNIYRNLDAYNVTVDFGLGNEYVLDAQVDVPVGGNVLLKDGTFVAGSSMTAADYLFAFGTFAVGTTDHEQVRFDNCLFDCADECNAVLIEYSLGILFTNCYIQRFVDYGIRQNTEARGCNYYRCTFLESLTNPYGGSPALAGYGLFALTDSQIIGCTFKFCGYGVRLGSGCLFIGNHTYGCQEAGVVVGSDMITISANEIDGDCILMVGNISQIKIVGNTFFFNSATKGQTTFTDWEGFDCTGNPAAIYIIPETTARKIEGLTITDNSFTNKIPGTLTYAAIYDPEDSPNKYYRNSALFDINIKDNQFKNVATVATEFEATISFVDQNRLRIFRPGLFKSSATQKNISTLFSIYSNDITDGDFSPRLDTWQNNYFNIILSDATAISGNLYYRIRLHGERNSEVYLVQSDSPYTVVIDGEQKINIYLAAAAGDFELDLYTTATVTTDFSAGTSAELDQVIVSVSALNGQDVVITPDGADTIDGGADYTMSTDYTAVILTPDKDSGDWKVDAYL